MARRGPLARFWRHPITVERHEGEGYAGPVYSSPVVVAGWVEDRAKLVMTATSGEVTSSARIMFPASTELIPLGSRVTLPDSHGARTSTVITTSVHDGGGNPTPDHHEYALE